MKWEQLVVLLVVGALAGSVAGFIVTFKKEGLGRWTNLAIGMLGALLGGFLFDLFKIDLKLQSIKVSLQDVIAATAGALLCIFAWKLIRRMMTKKKEK